MGPAARLFIDVSGHGKNQWWRYTLSILLVFILPIGAVGVAVEIGGWGVDEKTGQLIGVDPFVNYLLLNLSHMFMLLAVLFAVAALHKRPLLSLITPYKAVDWNKVGKSFVIFFGLVAVAGVIEYFLRPETFQFSLNPSRFFTLALVTLVLTPMQTTTEEILCRGYLLQMMALLTWNRVVLVLLSGLLFMLPHLANPEVEAGFIPMALYYFACGCFLTIVTLKSNGLEVAIGAHAAINLFTALVVNYANSVLTTESIFLCTKIDPVFSLISFCIGTVVFYLLMFEVKVSLHRPWIMRAPAG
jgi:membrane protease YdiL (CAAX protease family)